MGFLDGFLDKGINMFLNSEKTLGMVNAKIGRYARVESITKSGDSFVAVAQPAGTSDTVQVTVGKLSIAEDNTSVTLSNMSANVPWLNNILSDFVDGKEIPIPDAHRAIIGQAKNFLKL